MFKTSQTYTVHPCLVLDIVQCAAYKLWLAIVIREKDLVREPTAGGATKLNISILWPLDVTRRLLCDHVSS